MQQEIPAGRLSRVYSYDALGSFALIPLGLALAGPVAEASAPRDDPGRAAISLTATLAVLSSATCGRSGVARAEVVEQCPARRDGPGGRPSG